ncbi:hypothetical protein BKA93DRAFT_740936, partial [Sparassis latifolia]
FCKAVTEFLEADERNQVVIRWTPGHHKIDRNEKADQLAKDAADMETAGGEQATWAHMRRAAKESAIEAWRDAWRNDEDNLCNRWFGPANHLTPSL